VLSAFISPFRAERDMARSLIEEQGFIEIHVDCSVAEAEKRDPKGLYKKVREGKIKNFTGIDSPYESPEKPELHIDTAGRTADEAVDLIILELERRGILG